MSRYAVNALMREVLITDEALSAFRADPTGYVKAWTKRNHDAGTGVMLEREESEALHSRDYGTLYDSGAHPYLLWSFTEAVWVPEVSRPELVAAFKQRAAQSGYPDYRTIPAPALRYGILDTVTDGAQR